MPILQKIFDKSKWLFCLKDEDFVKNIEVVDGVIIKKNTSPALVPLPDSSEVRQELDKPAPTEILNEDEVCGAEKVEQIRGRPFKISRFFIHLESRNLSKNTIMEYGFDLKYWNKEAKKRKKSVYGLQKHEIEDIIKNLNPYTARRKIAFLKSLSKWYLDSGHEGLFKVLGRIIPPKLPDTEPKDRGEDFFREMFKKAKELCATQDRLGIWLGLLLTCGLRVSEIQTVVFVQTNQIRVTGKGNKERSMKILGWLYDAMKKQNRKNWCKGRKTIWRVLNKEKLGNPHSFRHSCASELLRRKKSFYDIKRQLGHKSVLTTEIYARNTNVPDIVDAWEQ